MLQSLIEEISFGPTFLRKGGKHGKLILQHNIHYTPFSTARQEFYFSDRFTLPGDIVESPFLSKMAEHYCRAPLADLSGIVVLRSQWSTENTTAKIGAKSADAVELRNWVC